MLRGLLLLALAVTTAACGTRQARTGETGRKGRIIAVTDTILDTGGTDTVRFGRMHSGEVAVLRLTRYDRNCGCTTLGYDAQPITPGDAQQVSLTFDARGEWGWQLKTLDIAFAGGRKPLRLFIEAEVE